MLIVPIYVLPFTILLPYQQRINSMAQYHGAACEKTGWVPAHMIRALAITDFWSDYLAIKST